MTSRDEIEARLAAATDVTWVHNGINGVHDRMGTCIALTHSQDPDQRYSDAEFIAHAPEDIQFLLDENKRLQAVNHWLKTEALSLLDSVAAGLEADATTAAHRAESARFRATAIRQRVEKEEA